VGSLAPYGYIKDENNRNKLIIDEETAVIVRRIFKMYIETQSITGIAKQLSFERVSTPSALKQLTLTQTGVYKGLWNNVMISRILTNPTYAGHLTQNRHKKVSYKVNKFHNIPKENWIIIPNTHKAIISEEDFNIVQSLLSKKNYTKTLKSVKRVHLLSGLVFCGDCKKPMTFSEANKKFPNVYLVCSARKRYGKNICTPKSIREDFLQNQVAGKIKETVEKHIDKKFLIENADIQDQYSEYTNNISKEKEEIEKQLEEIKNMIMSLYQDKVKKIITEQDFINLSQEFNSRREVLTERLNKIDGEINQTQENKKIIVSIKKILKDFLEFENIDRLTLVTLISRIEVYKDKTVIVKFNAFEL
jgi:hypothetical protein